MKKKKKVTVTFIYDSEWNQILKPCSLSEDGLSAFWLPLLLVQSWDRQQCWSCHRNGTKGMHHTTQPEVSALYRNIQVPQKLFSASPLENSLLTHPSCLFWSALLVWSWSQSWFAFSFLSLQCSGEGSALVSVMLCWQSMSRLENKEEWYALASRCVNCLKFLHGRYIQVPAGRWNHGWYRTSLFHGLWLLSVCKWKTESGSFRCSQ